MYSAILLLVVLLDVPPPPALSRDMKTLDGEWVLVAESLNGSPIRPPCGSFTVVFEGSRSTVLAGNEVTARWNVTLDPTTIPQRMDERADGKSLAEIYRLEGETLTIAFRNRWNDPRRPTDFKPRDGIGIYVLARRKR